MTKTKTMTKVKTKTKTKTDQIPVIWRHNLSGVWIGYLIGPSTIAGHYDLRGRRIRRWSGGRLDCSALAARGCTADDTLTSVRESVAIPIEGSCEIHRTTAALVDAALALPTAEMG